MLETYVKRLQELEGIAKSFNGVEVLCYPGRAGNPDHRAEGKVFNDESILLSKDIAKKIETEFTYPGRSKSP